MEGEAFEILLKADSVLEIRRASEPSHRVHIDEINKNKKELMRKMMKFNNGVNLSTRPRLVKPKIPIAEPSLIFATKKSIKATITVKNIVLNSDVDNCSSITNIMDTHQEQKRMTI